MHQPFKKENPPSPKNNKKNHVTTEPWKFTGDNMGILLPKFFCMLSYL
jgi:hypothetical protein